MADFALTPQDQLDDLKTRLQTELSDSAYDGLSDQQKCNALNESKETEEVEKQKELDLATLWGSLTASEQAAIEDEKIVASSLANDIATGNRAAVESKFGFLVARGIIGASSASALQSAFAETDTVEVTKKKTPTWVTLIAGVKDAPNHVTPTVLTSLLS